MARPASSYVPGQSDWKNGQPTDSNPTYGGLHFDEKKGWVTRSGDPIKVSSERVVTDRSL